MGDRKSVEAIECMAYIGQRRDNILHASNGRDFICSGPL